MVVRAAPCGATCMTQGSGPNHAPAKLLSTKNRASRHTEQHMMLHATSALPLQTRLLRRSVRQANTDAAILRLSIQHAAALPLGRKPGGRHDRAAAPQP